MIELRNITKRFGLTTLAVRNLSLEIKDHEFFVIYGPAGAGKTTTLRLIAGVSQPTSGDILRDGQSLKDVAPENRNMAMAFENYALYSHMSVRENLAFPLKAKKFSKGEIDERVQRIAKILQISDLLDRRPGFLSGGQRQRVSLGRAIIRPANLYLLDEPIGHLDAKLRHRMRAELKAMAVDLDATVALVTTSSREALAMGDRIAILHNGILEQVGTPEEIYHKPLTEFVASFVGEPPMSFLDVTLVQEAGQLALTLNGSSTKLLVSNQLAGNLNGNKDNYRLGVRASMLTIAGQKDDSHPVPGQVYVVEPLGYCNILTLRVGEGLLRVSVDPAVRPEPNETIWISLNSASVHLFHKQKAVSHPHSSNNTINEKVLP